MSGRSQGLQPLLPWAVAAVALAIGTAAVGALLYSRLAPASREFVQFNLRRLANFADARHDAAFRVVLLGDSRLKYATYEPRELESRLAAAIGRPVAVVRIVNNYGVFADFAPLAPRIAAARPGLVVLQQDLLWADRTWRRSAQLLGEQLLESVRPARPAVNDSEALGIQHGHPCWNRHGLVAGADGRTTRTLPSRRLADTDVAVNRSLARRSVAIRPDGAGPAAARQFIETQLASGAQVALLAVRPAPAYERHVAQHDRRDGAFERLQPPGGALVWSPPRQENLQYCDLTHLTPDGQREFSDWLVAAIALAAGRSGTAVTERGAAGRTREPRSVKTRTG